MESAVKFKRVAVYPSVLYGEDFIIESLKSILPHVDGAFVVMMKHPWGQTAGVEYRGEWVTWPTLQDGAFDRTREVVEQYQALNSAPVVLHEAMKFTPWNRWGFGVNSVVRGVHVDGTSDVDFDEVVILDPDCVFHDDEAKRAFDEWDAHPEYQWAHCEQIELWRTPAWQIKRPRSMISFHRGDLSLLDSPDPPGQPTRPELLRPKPVSHQLSARIHNLGFCVSEANMRWKHLCSMAFSPVVGESLPNPDWFDKVWKLWHPQSNNRNLDVSLGFEASVPFAIPYDVTGLPESIKRRYDAGEWPTYE